MTDPLGAYQANLDAVSDALWRNDRDAIGACLGDRVRIEMRGSEPLEHARSTVVALLLSFREAMVGLGATGYHRVADRASIDDRGRLVGEHRTYVLRGGNYVIDPYRCAETLRRDGDRWRLASTWIDRTRIGASTFHGDAPRAPHDIRTPRRLQ